MDNPRLLALNSLIKSDTQECFTNIEINTTLSRAHLEPNDASLYTLLYMGVTEKKMLLDHIIGQYSNTPLSKIDITALNLIRLGLYQILFTDRIPDYSAVNESVNLCPKKLKGFVNAVLRSFLRNDKKVTYPENEWEKLSIQFSVPMGIIEILRESYGDYAAKAVCSYEDKDHAISLRVNTLKTTVEELKEKIRLLGYEPQESQIAKDIIKCNAPVSKIKEIIDTGLAFVQDESSRICTLALDAKEGERVADVCACPGGKTFSIGIDMNNKGEIKASDLHKNKLSLISKGALRLGIDIISVKEQNAKEYKEEYKDCFDRVLCDVPCSGIGVMLKKPEIKYKSLDNVYALPEIQYAILSNCSKYVKVGGYLVYSTCTINKKENEDNVARFLKENVNFEPCDFNISNISSNNGAYTFLPHITGTDGFFVAKLKRVR